MPKRIIMIKGNDINLLKENLLHYYNFEGDAIDSIGGVNGNPISLSYSETNGVKVAKFNGVNAKIEFPSQIMVQGNDIRTVNIWIKSNSFDSTYGNPFGYFGSEAAYGNFSYLFKSQSQFDLRHCVGDVAVNVDTTGLNMWTYQFLGGLVTNAKLYKNGRYIGMFYLTAGQNGRLNTTSTYKILGFRPRMTDWIPAIYFSGDMGYFGIWDRLLTDNEITTLYNDGKGLKI